jgi:signal transduction histidine kinase
MLFVITAVVSIITFTMANLFHEDKSAYIHDLTAEMAMHTAAETHSMLVGYYERLQVFALLMCKRDLPQTQKSKLFNQLFQRFPEFVAITLYEKDREPITVYDSKTVEDAGLTKDVFLSYRRQNPIPIKLIEAGETFVENSTLSEKLPAFTMAIVFKSPEIEQEVVVEAVIHLQALLRLVQRSKIFTCFIVDYNGNPLAHSDMQMVINRTRVGWIPDIKSLEGKKSHGTTLEFTQDSVPMIGGLAGIDFSRLLSGVQIPTTKAYLTSKQLLNSLIFVSLVLLVVSAGLSLFWSHRLTRPLEHLSDATKVVGKGQFDIHIPASSGDEIGQLAGSFNQMASELSHREKELKTAQEALVQSEKMAAFGQLGAGIAHEVKNPLAGVLGLTQLCLLEAEKATTQFENLVLIEKETKRCKIIIENLLKFSRQEKISFDRIEINRGAEDAIAIVNHQMGINQVKLHHTLAADLPPIWGNANQIQQVFLNLMINAQQAMEGNPGEVTLTTASIGSGNVQIQIIDTGPGISKEHQAKIFEPFFTTKTSGKGTGLGLSVSYGIVKEHKGEILVKSKLGEGTTFTIILPVTDPADETGPAISQEKPLVSTSSKEEN